MIDFYMIASILSFSISLVLAIDCGVQIGIQKGRLISNAKA